MIEKAALEQQFRTHHPKGLWVLFFSELWERFCFYGMRALLVLYMTSDILNKGSAEAYGVYAAYGALVYATPLLGGFLADKLLGTRIAIIVGAILMAAGEFAMMVPDEFVFYGALALIALGNGFFKPNISSTVGQLYAQGDPLRDSGFTIFYMGINIGAFVAPLACGFLGEQVGWAWGFGLAGVGIVFGLLVFLWGQRFLEGKGLPPDPAKAKKFGIPVVLGCIVALVPALYYLLSHDEFTKILLYWIVGAVVLYVLYFAYSNERVVRDRTLVFLVLAFFHTMFWALFEQAGSSLTIYARDCVDRNIGDWTMPTSFSQSFNPFFIIALGVPFSVLWIFLSKRNKNPSIPQKFGLALIQLGLGYYILVLGASSGLLSSTGLVLLA
ncbi:MAG: oligopeptide:H+ symporter, partial [Planctomycetota bacterium]|nr:oligopeptide:H+ symporter [Planctomycetota bacterium]